jgi:hypothetical protein
MPSILLRRLMLVCGLSLALPPGWCCMLPALGAFQETEPVASNPPSCCECCKVPAPTKTPAPRPAPLPPGKCPCDDRHSATPDGPKVVGCDLAAATPSPVLDLPPAAVEGCRAVSSPFCFGLSLQLLHRVWLC